MQASRSEKPSVTCKVVRTGQKKRLQGLLELASRLGTAVRIWLTNVGGAADRFTLKLDVGLSWSEAAVAGHRSEPSNGRNRWRRNGSVAAELLSMPLV
jgi:hypothetical protein